MIRKPAAATAPMKAPRPSFPWFYIDPWSADRRGRRLHDLRFGKDFHLAGEHAAPLDLELAVADLAEHLAAGADDQALTRGQIAVEPAADIGNVDFSGALELAGSHDFDVLAVLQNR